MIAETGQAIASWLELAKEVGIPLAIVVPFTFALVKFVRGNFMRQDEERRQLAEFQQTTLVQIAKDSTTCIDSCTKALDRNTEAFDRNTAAFEKQQGK